METPRVRSWAEWSGSNLSVGVDSHDSPCSAQRLKNQIKTKIYVVSSGVNLFMVGMKYTVHLGLKCPTVNAAKESCGQTLPKILVFAMSLRLFPSSPLKPNCLEYCHSFPALMTSFEALSASERIGIWADGFCPAVWQLPLCLLNVNAAVHSKKISDPSHYPWPLGQYFEIAQLSSRFS